MTDTGRELNLVGGEAQVFEISIVVRNLAESMEQFRSVFGWEPYAVREDEARDFELHGKKVKRARMKYALYHAGPVRIELTEALEGDSVYAEYLQQHGPGVQHIGIRVSNRDRELAKLQEKGIGVLQSMEIPFLDFKMAYVDTMDLIGVSLELVESPHTPAEPGFDDFVKARLESLKRK
ncbi:MAG: VOC family protein [Dehalococcoidia bacterium]